MIETVYTVRDTRGGMHPVLCAERAERLSRSGFRVTATTRGTGDSNE